MPSSGQECSLVARRVNGYTGRGKEGWKACCEGEVRSAASGTGVRRTTDAAHPGVTDEQPVSLLGWNRQAMTFLPLSGSVVGRTGNPKG